MEALFLLFLISKATHIISSIDVDPTGFRNSRMYLDEADIDIYFVGSFTVRDLIHCCSECTKEEHGGDGLRYALYLRNGNVCVCKTNFEWRHIAVGTIEIQRIQLTTG